MPRIEASALRLPVKSVVVEPALRLPVAAAPGTAYPNVPPVGSTRVERTDATRSAAFPAVTRTRTGPVTSPVVGGFPKASESSCVAPGASVKVASAASLPGEKR